MEMVHSETESNRVTAIRCAMEVDHCAVADRSAVADHCAAVDRSAVVDRSAAAVHNAAEADRFSAVDHCGEAVLIAPVAQRALVVQPLVQALVWAGRPHEVQDGRYVPVELFPFVPAQPAIRFPQDVAVPVQSQVHARLNQFAV